MIVREATMDDALAIHTGAKEFAKFTALGLFPDDEDKFIAAIGRTITNDYVEVLVAEHEGKIVGGIGVVYGPFLWNPDILIGEELFWWAFEDAPARAGKMLYNEAIKRIEFRKAIPYFKSLANSPESVDKLYLKDGFRLIEKGYMKL